MNTWLFVHPTAPRSISIMPNAVSSIARVFDDTIATGKTASRSNASGAPAPPAATQGVKGLASKFGDAVVTRSKPPSDAVGAAKSHGDALNPPGPIARAPSRDRILLQSTAARPRDGPDTATSMPSESKQASARLSFEGVSGGLQSAKEAYLQHTNANSGPATKALLGGRGVSVHTPVLQSSSATPRPARSTEETSSTSVPSTGGRRLSVGERVRLESTMARECSSSGRNLQSALASTPPTPSLNRAASMTTKSPLQPPPSPSLANVGGLSALKSAYVQSLARDEEAAVRGATGRPSLTGLGGLKAGRREAFLKNMDADNAKRGVGVVASGPEGELPSSDVNALLARVEASDASLPVLDLCGNAQLSWLSASQRVRVLAQRQAPRIRVQRATAVWPFIACAQYYARMPARVTGPGTQL